MWPWLSAIAGWFVKLIGGWLPIGTKPLPEYLGKIIFYVGTSVMVFFILTGGFSCKKKPSVQPPNQTAGGDILYVQPRFGCVTINEPKGVKNARTSVNK